MMDNCPHPPLGASIYSNNSTHSHNISNSYNSINSNLINYGTILYVPPNKNAVELAEALKQTSLNEDGEEGSPADEGVPPLPYRLQGGSVWQDSSVHNQGGHHRAESAMAQYAICETRYEVLAMKSTEGTTCRPYPLTRKFIREYESWINLWVLSQGFKPGPGDVGYIDRMGRFEILFNIYLSEEANLKHDYHPPSNFINLSADGDQPWVEEYLEDKWAYHIRNGDLDFYKKPQQNGERMPEMKEIMSGTVLLLPDGIIRTTIKSSGIDKMRGYLDIHGPEWYKFYKTPQGNNRGVQSAGSELVLSWF
ncbi:hypothetical protein CPB84DRAFT_1746509 [Gymnopilus junonius]|uniref:Uncharacterized protein n=1 Tax=Gymnopilus junonius TaxID=109634 RepID=A0A9P5NRE0_GYMJU|nr:hypothetical protein CPB84DRAFT_1746509 [Gymnopilus junonius]